MMDLKAYAKLNLTLDITGIRQDGYHTLSSVMQEISLCDDVSVNIEKAKQNSISITAFGADIPTDETNTCYKAATEFLSFFNIKKTAVDIVLTKRIPVAAGMGGGSSDAAAVLKALNVLTGVNVPDDLLEKLALRIGADVPFFIKGGLQHAGGIGEILTPIKSRIKPYFVIAKPKCEAFSGSIYKAYDKLTMLGKIQPSAATTKRFVAALVKNDDPFRYVGNMLTAATVSQCADVGKLLRHFKAKKINACMTGSGTAVFAPFYSYSAAVDAIAAVRTNSEEYLAICVAN